MKKWNMYTARELRADGWLQRQLRLQAEGLSGNLDKVWPDVRDSAWIGGEREGWERVPYWLDGFIPLAYLLEDEELIARAKKYIDAIIAAQRESGWICPCEESEIPTYDTWAVQLIAKVLTVYYECSSDERVPAVLYKVLKNYYELLSSEKIKLFSWGKARWYETFIAIDFVYKQHPEAWLKELARILKEQGTDYTKLIERWKRPLYKWTQETHIVNLTMMLKAEAVSADLLDRPYTDEAEKLRSILDEYNGTVYESFTGDECLSGLSPIQGTELCAIVEQMYSYELLFAYTGDSKWAERLEVLAFNALPATISQDMWTHQYVQLSNQIACAKFPGKSIFRTNGPEAHRFGLEPNYGCCTANFNQGWPKLALSTFMYSGNTVINSIPIPSRLKTRDKTIRLETEYPFNNRMKYTVTAEKEFVFKIRIPSFAENLTVNGKRVEEKELSFNIEKGTTEITVDFETVPYFQKRPYGLRAVRLGSMIFSLPIRYEKIMFEYDANGVQRKFPYCDYDLLPVSDWNYAYCGKELSVQRCKVSDIPFSEEAPPVTIRTTVKKINWGLADGYESVCAKVPESLTPISKAEEIELYPYGCAKLRMTEMPIID